jgi:hypothetical protein
MCIFILTRRRSTTTRALLPRHTTKAGKETGEGFPRGISSTTPISFRGSKILSIAI